MATTLQVVISRRATSPYNTPPAIRQTIRRKPLQLRLYAGFPRSGFEGQPYTSSYETDQPTRGPLGQAAHVASRITPKRLKEHLDKFVVGQERAKKMLSVAVYNQYQRIREMQRQEDEERERYAKITRMSMAQEKFGRYAVENGFSAQSSSNDPESVDMPRDTRVGSGDLDDLTPTTIEKSNILVLGPSGVGKTMMIKILARILDVPFSMSDCTPFTQAGYIGEDAEVCVQRLLVAADYDVARAEVGIICLDEVDKLAMAKAINGKDVSGEGVQQALLKIIEGTTLYITAKAERSSQRVSPHSNNFPSTFNGSGSSPSGSKPETYAVRTDNILFICSGAFVGLQQLILNRVSRGSIGFGATIRGANDSINPLTLTEAEAAQFRKHHASTSLSSASSSPYLAEVSPQQEYNPLDLATPADFQKYGLIPEFIGRIPIATALSPLSLPELVRILTEPRNSLVQQYTALLASSGVELRFTTGALHEIAREGQKMGTGARGLRSAIEQLLWPVMYEVPGGSVRHVLVTEAAAKGEGQIGYWGRGQAARFHEAIKSGEMEWTYDEAKRRGDVQAGSFEELRFIKGGGV